MVIQILLRALSQTLCVFHDWLIPTFAPFGQTPPAVPDFKPSAALDKRQNNSCVVATLQQCSSDPPILKRKWIPTVHNNKRVPVSSIEDGEDPRKMASNGCMEPQAAPTLSWIYEEAGISCGDPQNEDGSSSIKGKISVGKDRRGRMRTMASNGLKYANGLASNGLKSANELASIGRISTSWLQMELDDIDEIWLSKSYAQLQVLLGFIFLNADLRLF